MSYSYSIQGGTAPAFSSRKAKQQQQQQNDYDYDQRYQQDYTLHQRSQQQQKLQVRDTAPQNSRQTTCQQSSGRFSHRPTSSVYSQVSFIDPGSQLPRPAPSSQHYQYATEPEQAPPPPPKPYENQPQYPEPSDDETERRTRYRSHSLARYQTNAHGISPESSPERSTAGYLHDNDASYQQYEQYEQYSTMSAAQSVTDGASASRTNIPTMRRERRQSQTSSSRSLREATSRERLQEQTGPSVSPASKRGYKGGEVKWDPRTGELTSSQKGRPSQVKPIEYARGFAPTDATSGSRTESASDEPKTEVAAMASRLKKTAELPRLDKAASTTPKLPTLRSVSAAVAPSPPRETTDPAAGAFTSNRPAWHGASGRTTLVAPVHDTQDVAPLNIPRRSSKRVGSVPQLQKALNAAKAAGGLTSPPESPSSRGVETPARKAMAALGRTPTKTTASSAYPSPPLREHSSMNTLRKRTPSHQNLASFDADDPFNYNNRANPNLAVTPPELRPPVNASDEPDEPAEWTQSTPGHSDASFSTIRESVNETDSSAMSARSSPFLIKRRPTANDSAASASIKSLTPSDSDSVMDRRRPPRLGHNPKTEEPVVISLSSPYVSEVSTPVRSPGSERDEFSSLYERLRGNKNRTDADDASLSGDVHKNLPPAPPEMSAKDRVAMLNAQLASLAQRRENINRSIKQMTELMPTDKLLAKPDVLHKREMEKLKVESLRLDLAEIQREQYEIGLKLHRAYKRLDKNAEYEPTTLWVRRVTG